MTVRRLVLVKGKADSGKSTVLKTVANKVLARGDAIRLFMCKGACQRMAIEQILFGQGDVTIVIEVNGLIIVFVTMGDEPDVAERVKRLLDSLQILENRRVDLLVAAVRDTRNHRLEDSYRGLFGNPTVIEKRRMQGDAPVDPNNLNADDRETVRGILDIVNEVVG